MSTSQQSSPIPTLVQFSAMVFGGADPKLALQDLANAIGVTTVAIHREGAGAAQLAHNKGGTPTHDPALTFRNTSKAHHIVLQTSTDLRDILVIQSKTARLLPDQINMLTDSAEFLSAAWQARSAGFEQSLTPQQDILPTGHILHRSNPSNLTRTEIRVCELIGLGQRPKAIAQSLDASMPTIRTHLRNIYAKTGLDGMLGVMHNLQSFDIAQDDAA